MNTWKVFWALIFGLTTSVMALAQDCPDITNPVPGSTNVPVSSSISWDDVPGVTGYIVSLGTSPGGVDIVDNQPVGNDPNFIPPLGLPSNTQVYITITLFFFDQEDIICPSESFRTELVSQAPGCGALTTPLDGEVDVNVGTDLFWEYVPLATGYRLSLGTTPGGVEILDNQDLGNVLSYSPPTNFPPGTSIYSRLQPYNAVGSANNCGEESFTTGELGDPPPCTQLITPFDGEINVPLTPLIEWEPAPGAIGYKLFIGSTPFMNDVVDGIIISDTSTLVLDFDPNQTYFVRIIPFNKAGDAQGCLQESFSTILGCGPFIDPDTGEVVVLNPMITIPDRVGICDGQLPTRYEAPDQADGYRWFKQNEFGGEQLISEERFVDLEEVGNYRHEAFVLTDSEGETLECTSEKEFEVVLSGIARIDLIRKEEVAFLFYVEIEVSGAGDYEYSLNDIDGPYQDSNDFGGLSEGFYTIYVRDKGGCGIAQEDFQLAFPPTGFPPYFSPNGDGINDYWQYIPPRVNPIRVSSIFIFDRFGKLLVNFGPTSLGWDGIYNGNPMPSGGYWFRALTHAGEEYRGYFSLVR